MSPHEPTEDSDPTEMLPAREWVEPAAAGDTLAPGTRTVSYTHLDVYKRQEGLDSIFEEAGFQLSQPGCSACLGMNEDKIPAGQYCISTSNRNFEGRQGQGARTLLASPLTAAAAAVTGVVTDVREMLTVGSDGEL